MNITSKIIQIYRNSHIGQGKAITKERFINRYLKFEDEMEDVKSERDFRKALASYDEDNLPLIPICSCSKGHFWPKSLHEVRAWEQTERRRALSVLSRIKRVRDFHEERFRKEAFEQINLPL